MLLFNVNGWEIPIIIIFFFILLNLTYKLIIKIIRELKK